MDFSLTDEQQQLKDSLCRYLDKNYSFEARRQQLKTTDKYCATHWRAFADMGLLGIGVPEEFGGMGAMGNGAECLSVIMECFGRALVVEPYLATVVLCASVLREAASQTQKESILAEIVAGNTVLALAVQERSARYRLSHVTTSAQRDGDGYLLSGAKMAVLHGDAADTLIVSARSSGQPGDQDGISLFLVDKNAAGLTIRGYRTHDGMRAAEVTFKDVRVAQSALVGPVGAGYAALARSIEYARVALCAEAVGAMTALSEQTLEYLKTRKQFGVAIGSFQVLKHRMVDVFNTSEQARSITMLAAIKADAADAGERRRSIAAAKSLVGQAARSIGQEAVQMHGGMGVTDELACGHYFKRLTAIDLTLGDADYCRAELGDLLAAT